MEHSRFRVLRNRGFRNLWLAGWLSELGSEASAIAIFLYLFRSLDSILHLALITVLRTLPAVLIAPLAGVAVDRMNKRHVMIAADVLRTGLLVAMIAFPSVAFLYAIALVSSLAGELFEPARSASIPGLLHAHDVPDANGLDQTMYSLTMIGGPLAGALLYTRVGLSFALALDAFSFLVSAILIWKIALPGVPAMAPSERSAWRDAKEGWSYLRSTPLLRQLTLLWFLSTLAVGMWGPMAPFFNRDALHGGDEVLGYQFAAFGLAGALGGMAVPAAYRRCKPGYLLIAAMLLEGLHIFLFSMAGTVWSSILILLPWGFVVAAIFIVTQSLLQTCSAPSLLGRVLSTVKQGEHLAQIGSLGAAVVLSGVLPVRAIFRFAGLFYVSVIAISLFTRGGLALLSVPGPESPPGQCGWDSSDHHHRLKPEGLPPVINN
jgi:DHA3 family macrolide efflux protein-like MFS transporter